MLRAVNRPLLTNYTSLQLKYWKQASSFATLANVPWNAMELKWWILLEKPWKRKLTSLDSPEMVEKQRSTTQIKSTPAEFIKGKRIENNVWTVNLSNEYCWSYVWQPVLIFCESSKGCRTIMYNCVPEKLCTCHSENRCSPVQSRAIQVKQICWLLNTWNTSFL